MCDQHGGAAPQVLRRAAERIQFTADDAAQQLVEWMNDPNVEMRERVKIAQDLLDRGGLAGAQLLKIMPVTEDPVEKLFKSIFSTEDALLDPATASPELPATPTAELPELPELPELGDEGEVVEAELVEDEPELNRSSTVPPKHIREALDLLI